MPTMIQCRRFGIVPLTRCPTCPIPKLMWGEKKLATGEFERDRGPWKGTTVPAGGCPFFDCIVSETMTTDSPFVVRQLPKMIIRRGPQPCIPCRAQGFIPSEKFPGMSERCRACGGVGKVPG